MAKAISVPGVTEVRHRARAEGADTLFFQFNELAEQLRSAYMSRFTVDRERLRRLTENCFSIHQELDDIRLGKKPTSAIAQVEHTFYEAVTSSIEQWSEEMERGMGLYGPSPRSGARSTDMGLTKTETVEGVIHELSEEDAVVILMVEDQPEKRIMSRRLLARAGIARQGQPFTIEIREETTSEGVTIVKRIRATGAPDKWTVKRLRPDLDIEKFKRPPEQKNAQD